LPLIPRVLSLWRNLVRRGHADRELDAEVRAAFDMLVDEKRSRGMGPEDARRAATLELGRIEIVTEQVRDVRAGALADACVQDLRHGARLLRRSPLFALTAALSLAIGMGATTTIFAIANALLFRAPVGVSEPERLLDISRAEAGTPFPSNFTTSYPYYRDVRLRTKTLGGLYAFEFDVHPISLGLRDGTEYAFANVVTANYFAVLGVAPAAGRLFSARDSDEPRASPVVVFSHRLWQRRFNGDPAIVGQAVQINRHPFTVVGVAREGFRGTNLVSPDLWVPMGMVEVVQPGTTRLTSRRPADVGMGGRLAPGASSAEAAAELDVIARELERENPVEDRGTRLRVAGLSSVPGALATVAAGLFALLMALTSVVLIIACANVAGVLLAREAARRREIAVRIAIGAGRARLVRQVLTETMLLFLLGGAAGLFLARGMTSLLLSILPAFPIPIEVSLPLDVRVIVFSTGLALAAALLSGLAPALHVTEGDVISSLKDESQGPSERLLTRSAFVIAQVAFSIMLVVAAGLLVKALERTSSFDQGFDPQGVEVASLDLSSAGYTAATGALFARDLIERLRALPGVRAATLSEFLPGRGGADVRVTVPGVSPADGQPYFIGTWNAVDADFFATLRIPLVAGRGFTAADRAGTQPVIIVSETSARHFWPGQEPVGQYIAWHDLRPNGEEGVTPLLVIGVARDLRPPLGAAHGDTRERSAHNRRDGQQVTASEPAPSTLMMYVPLQQRYTPRLEILARTAGGQRMASEMRHLVSSLDPSLPISTPQPLASQTGPVYLQLRITASVAGGVGLVGLLLAAIGVYGVTAYTTARRTREIGIRMAMGAQRHDVVGMVLRQGLSLVVVGSAIGLTLAAAGSRVFTRLLFGVPPLDPVTFGGAAILFAVIGLAACYVPARRATRIEATQALRYE
jgi:predicted permease